MDYVFCVLLMLSLSDLITLSMSVAGGWETNYSCCASAVGSPGCQVAKVMLKNSTT